MKAISVFGVFVADLCFISNTIPEKGQTVLGSQHIIGPGGKGSNQAIAAAKLGGSVNFITKIGKDKNSEMALALYRDLGMHTACIIKDENHSTGVAGIMVNEKAGENAINIIPGAAGTLTNDDIDSGDNRSFEDITEGATKALHYASLAVRFDDEISETWYVAGKVYEALTCNDEAKVALWKALELGDQMVVRKFHWALVDT